MSTRSLLPPIPVLDVGPAFPLETLRKDEARAHALLDSATRHVPRTALRALDSVSRHWLRRWDNPHLAEIDAIAHRLGRPGAGEQVSLATVYNVLRCDGRWCEVTVDKYRGYVEQKKLWGVYENEIVK